jgi:hypothetical protein
MEFDPKQISQQFIQLAEALPKVALAVVGSAYVIGVFIRSVHVMSYGLFYLDFLKVEYVLTGILWIVLTAATYIYLNYLIRGIKNDWNTSKRSKPIRTLIYLLWTISSLGFLVGLVLWSLSPQLYNLPASLIVVAILILTVTIIHALQSSLKRLMAKRLRNSTDLKAPNASEMLSMFLGVVFCLSLYARFAFPKLSHRWGGGSPQSAVLVVKNEKLESFIQMSFGVDPATRRTTPVVIILEGPDFLFLLPPAGTDQSSFTGVRFPKDALDAIYYLPERHP